MNTRAPFDALTDIVNAQLPLEAQARYWDTVLTSLTDHVRREVPDTLDPEFARCGAEPDEPTGLTDTAWFEDQCFSPRG